MVVKIRLARFGRKHAPVYNIVIAQARTARNSKPMEVIGTYDPIPKEPLDGVGRKYKDIQLDIARAKYWLGVGAQATDPMWKLLSMAGLIAPKYRSNMDKVPTLEEVGFKDPVDTVQEEKAWRKEQKRRMYLKNTIRQKEDQARRRNKDTQHAERREITMSERKAIYAMEEAQFSNEIAYVAVDERAGNLAAQDATAKRHVADPLKAIYDEEDANFKEEIAGFAKDEKRGKWKAFKEPRRVKALAEWQAAQAHKNAERAAERDTTKALRLAEHEKRLEKRKLQKMEYESLTSAEKTKRYEDKKALRDAEKEAFLAEWREERAISLVKKTQQVSLESNLEEGVASGEGLTRSEVPKAKEILRS